MVVAEPVSSDERNCGRERRDSAENGGDTARTYIPYPVSKMFRYLSQRFSATYISATPSVLLRLYSTSLTLRKHGFTFGTFILSKFPKRIALIVCRPTSLVRSRIA